MPNQDLNRLLQYLRNNPLVYPKHCDNCGHEHKQNDLNLESANNGQIMLRLHCEACGLVQLIRLNPGGGLSIQRFEINNSDITGAEFKKFAGKPTVNHEEVLDVYADMLNVADVNDFLQLVEARKESIN